VVATGTLSWVVLRITFLVSAVAFDWSLKWLRDLVIVFANDISEYFS